MDQYSLCDNHFIKSVLKIYFFSLIPQLLHIGLAIWKAMLQLCFNFFSNLNAPPILTHPFISWYLITSDGSKLRVGRASLGKEEGLSTILWLCDPQKLCKNTQWPQELFGVSQSSEAKQAGTLQPPQNKPQRSPQMFPETQHKLKSASTPIPPQKQLCWLKYEFFYSVVR